ncbi:MAG: protein-(glutamine-N5) methyltransferase, release factor-specific [Euryarchaeota archaeon]|nr:protein-(glutamine-N5) methyltransferase, release factor-specific [Euryarchaeota archaeon]
MIQRGKGPWPSGNDELTVKQWFIQRISETIEEAEHIPLAKICLDHVSGQTRGERIVSDYRFPESELDQLAVIAEEILVGRPIQYVLGKTWFCDLEMYIAEGALIPRPETEELVHKICSELNDEFRGEVLDVGTGSGCIALALKNANPMSDVIGIDVSDDALKIAKQNGQNLGLGVEFSKLDILSETPNSSFDVVVSNPPYILESERESMKSRVKDFEPNIALFVNCDPLLFYKRIVDLCCDGVLKSGGLLALECNRAFASDVAILIDKSPCFNKAEIITDLQGNERHVIARSKVN